MYPAHFFGLFPAFPRKPTIFVAMSFDSRFEYRWREVIRPAVASVTVSGQPLEAMRVDARIVGDSILTEILSGIGSAQAVFADVTSLETAHDRPVRNGNVMYEVGLAHAVRLPEEVLLFRSDREPLLFDTANVRVNFYSPDDRPAEAKQQVTDAIASTLREIILQRHLAVKAVADSLDAASFEILHRCKADGRFGHPDRLNMGQALSAVSIEAALQRLLTLGLLETRFSLPVPRKEEALLDAPAGRLMLYIMTVFGEAVFQEVASRVTAALSDGIARAKARHGDV